MGRKWGKNDINRPKLIMDVPAGQTSPKCIEKGYISIWGNFNVAGAQT
jgi:hypothetical protein